MQSYGAAQKTVAEEIKEETGLMAGYFIEDVYSLETRSLKERMERHRAISDILRRSNPEDEDSSDEEDYE